MTDDTTVALTGQLICADAAEAEIVRRQLPTHITLTRAEAGCRSFEVTPDGPLIWQVRERFATPAAFRAHQSRVAASEWGRATAAIRRAYSVSGLPA